MALRPASPEAFEFYFPGDDCGLVAYCHRSGNTHFINAPGPALRELLAIRVFSSQEICRLTELDEDTVKELQEKLISVGILELTA